MTSTTLGDFSVAVVVVQAVSNSTAMQVTRIVQFSENQQDVPADSGLRAGLLQGCRQSRGGIALRRVASDTRPVSTLRGTGVCGPAGSVVKADRDPRADQGTVFRNPQPSDGGAFSDSLAMGSQIMTCLSAVFCLILSQPFCSSSIIRAICSPMPRPSGLLVTE